VFGSVNGNHRATKITPDILMQMLTERGLGSPRIYRYPPLPPEHVTDLHYAGRRKITYYMEKLKGRSRMDCDAANAKALAFCEEQREASHALKRTGSAVFRSRSRRQLQVVRIADDERSFVGSKTINSKAETGGEIRVNTDDKTTLLLERINTWIDGCDEANAKGFQNVPIAGNPDTASEDVQSKRP
jgi:hypothetical protein